MLAFTSLAALSAGVPTRQSELLPRAEVEKLGIVWRGNSSAQSSHELLEGLASYPDEFTWCDKDGVNYCTPSLNQHIPQVGALSQRLAAPHGHCGLAHGTL